MLHAGPEQGLALLTASGWAIKDASNAWRMGAAPKRSKLQEVSDEGRHRHRGCGAHAGRLIQRLTEVWDVVIIDSPPIGPVADAQILAAAAEGVLVVARSGRTHRTGLRGALESVRTAGRPLLGIVLNDLRPGPLSRYRTYGYYYSGYYGKYHSKESNGPVENGVNHHHGNVNGQSSLPLPAPARKRP